MIDGFRIEAGVDTCAFTLPYCYLKNARTYTVNGKERTTVGGEGWHGELYSYSQGTIRRRWWRFTVHTPKDGLVSLFTSSTLTPAIKAVLLAAGAPAWITGQMDAIKFCRVDVAYDLLGYDGVAPLDDADRRTAKIRQLTEYKFADGDQPNEPSTLYLCSGKRPDGGKIPVHTAAFVQCRYDKRRQMKEIYGVDISPRSRIENRYQSRKMCVRHGLGSLPEIVLFLTGLEEETERRNSVYSNADTPPSDKKPTPSPQQSPTPPETPPTPTPHQTPTPSAVSSETPPFLFLPPSGILSPLGKGTASFAIIRAPPTGKQPFPAPAA